MNAGTYNKKYTGQHPTKEVLGNELEGDFISIKKIDWCQQLWTTKHNPRRDLTQA